MTNKRRVWAIPLASKGFAPVDPVTNPVRWFLEDVSTGKVVDTKPHETKEAAEAQGRRNGWIVEDGGGIR